MFRRNRTKKPALSASQEAAASKIANALGVLPEYEVTPHPDVVSLDIVHSVKGSLLVSAQSTPEQASELASKLLLDLADHLEREADRLRMLAES